MESLLDQLPPLSRELLWKLDIESNYEISSLGGIL